MISSINSSLIVDDAAIPYSSLTSLREAHTRLLKRYRDGVTEEVIAEMDAFIRQARATGAILHADDDRWASQSLLDYWVTVLYRAKRIPPDATLAEFDPSLAPKLDDALSPYMGLNAFDEKDKDVFFGREWLVELLVDHLRKERLLIVLGPSGSGKSSLVLAGLLPALKRGALDKSESWRYYPRIVPGSNPLRNLALALNPSNKESTEWVQQQVQSFERSETYLLEVLSDIGGQSAVFFVDQFEEFFTLCSDAVARQSFVANLMNVVRTADHNHVAVLTMRSDFESKVVCLPELLPLFNRAQVRVTPLSANELHDAIQKPAERIGLEFEDGIIDSLVRDILGEPAGLPLLQFALLRLWKSREGNLISWKAYKTLGGARGALALTADEFYRGLLYEDQQTVKRILLRLVSPSEGLEVTSNRVRREALYIAGEARDRVDSALEKLVEAGLVRLSKGSSADQDRVEVAHEALVRNWPTLVGWLEDERAILRRRIRLTSAAEQWLAHGKDSGGLLGGSLLEEAGHYDDLNDLEAEFVRASVVAAVEAEREKESAQLREVELEKAQLLAEERKQRAEEEARTSRKLRYLLAALVMVILVAIIAVIAAVVQWKSAKSSGEKLADTNNELKERNDELKATNDELNKRISQAEEAKIYKNITTTRNEAQALVQQGRYREAIAKYKEYLKTYSQRNHTQEDERDLLFYTLMEMGYAYHKWGFVDDDRRSVEKFQFAERAYSDALGYRKKHSDNEKTQDIATTYHKMASLLDDEAKKTGSRYDNKRALRWCNLALNAKRKLLEPTHPDVKELEQKIADIEARLKTSEVQPTRNPQ
jgi:energy-coupling factor transporter ATP-binding protein EcfA2